MKPKKNYDKLKVTKEVDSYEAWDSDVARGSLHALLNPPHDPNKKRPSLGWEDEDCTHDSWMRAVGYAIAARKAAGLL